MEFNRIKNDVRGIPFDTLRVDCDNLFEAVVAKDEVAKLTERLEGFFGPPAWPSKEKLTFQVRQLIDGYGGIMPGQTLYLRNEGSFSVMAMLWPWQDGIRTTVKIIKTI